MYTTRLNETFVPPYNYIHKLNHITDSTII